MRVGDAAADVTGALRESLAQFERSKPGFLTSQALLHGVETRTSCPVTIGALCTWQHTFTPVLYPESLSQRCVSQLWCIEAFSLLLWFC